MPSRRPQQQVVTLPQGRKLAPWVLLSAAIAVSLGAAVALNWSTAATVGADPDNPSQVSLGREIYADNCASCHGAKLEGQQDWKIRKPDGRLPAPPHDASGHTWHHPEQQLFRIIKIGVKPPLAPEGYESDMPAFGEVLTDEEIWAVLAFIKSTWPPEIRARHTRRSKAAAQ